MRTHSHIARREAAALRAQTDRLTAYSLRMQAANETQQVSAASRDLGYCGICAILPPAPPCVLSSLRLRRGLLCRCRQGCPATRTHSLC